ncbi:glycosyltransferase [Algoriphagus kandeliae]|uniref:Glycosyltransferase n=1 Tax=Algoriphagus kandeliae TaxID=2562278 RepID=A0A4Y9QY47_9BACT|nr:glycosyltransferase family 4 protein [Algoriphagus kandeliae]TFV97269.1 glycosyltransferase [Algoriphagus kandeliae]
MKIFQVIQRPQARGVELFTALLSEELQKLGHDVVLISIFEGSAELPFSGKQIHLNRPLNRRFWDWSAWKKFGELVKKESPDLIQANAADTLKFTVLSKMLFGWKTPVIFRNASLMSTYIQSIGVKKFNEFLLNQVDGIASVCEASQNDLNATFLLKKPTLGVLPIGIQIPEISIKSQKNGPMELVHIGGFTFEKNHQGLLSIFEEIKERFPDAKLKLIGDGPLFPQIKEEIQKRGLIKSIELLGALSNPFSHLSKNSILILPSLIEGLPSVLLEAMYHRIPVIAYGVGGIPKILKNGETGWCIPPRDSQAFIQSIQDVLTLGEESKQKILDQAHQLVTTHYSLPQVTLQFEQFYKSLLDKN